MKRSNTSNSTSYSSYTSTNDHNASLNFTDDFQWYLKCVRQFVAKIEKKIDQQPLWFDQAQFFFVVTN